MRVSHTALVAAAVLLTSLSVKAQNSLKANGAMNPVKPLASVKMTSPLGDVSSNMDMFLATGKGLVTTLGTDLDGNGLDANEVEQVNKFTFNDQTQLMDMQQFIKQKDGSWTVASYKSLTKMDRNAQILDKKTNTQVIVLASEHGGVKYKLHQSTDPLYLDKFMLVDKAKPSANPLPAIAKEFGTLNSGAVATSAATISVAKSEIVTQTSSSHTTGSTANALKDVQGMQGLKLGDGMKMPNHAVRSEDGTVTLFYAEGAQVTALIGRATKGMGLRMDQVTNKMTFIADDANKRTIVKRSDKSADGRWVDQSDQAIAGQKYKGIPSVKFTSPVNGINYDGFVTGGGSSLTATSSSGTTEEFKETKTYIITGPATAPGKIIQVNSAKQQPGANK